MLTLLGAGELAVDIPEGGSKTFYVAGGVLKVEAGVVTVLTEYAGTEAPESLPETVNLDPSDLREDPTS
jgi:F0F1-type ATP synthase epsilon subunit